LASDLPCAKDCPPPSATTDALRQVLHSWIGAAQTPPKTVLCTPSKSTEAWIMAIFFPGDTEMKKLGWECHPNPESRLAQQPIKIRFAKRQLEYQAKRPGIKAGWAYLTSNLSEAARFQNDFLAAVQKL
jgi:hypothetical protein